MRLNETESVLFQLLRLGFGTEKGGREDFAAFRLLRGGTCDSLFWEELFRLGVEQGVAAVLFDGLQRVVERGGVPDEALPTKALKWRWLAHTLQVERHCQTQYELAGDLAGMYAAQGLRTVVLKGIAAGRDYPHPLHRPCGDFDCYLMGDYERGNAVAEAAGVQVDRRHYKHAEFCYKGLMVENHRYFTAIRGSRRVKSFERLLCSLLEEEGTEAIEGTSIECPSPLFNALFLTQHAQRHFLYEGIALRHLCDWAMLLRRHGGEIDWGRFCACCDEYGLRHFADSMTRLSRDLVGGCVPDGFRIAEDAVRDDFLLRDILYGQQHLYRAQGSGWRTRLLLLRNLPANRRRFRLFSAASCLSEGMRLVYGFCFDRHPEWSPEY